MSQMCFSQHLRKTRQHMANNIFFPERVCEGFILKISFGIRRSVLYIVFIIFVIFIISIFFIIFTSSLSLSLFFLLSLSLSLSLSRSLARSSFFSFLGAGQRPRKSCAEYLWRSGPQVSKIERKLRFLGARSSPLRDPALKSQKQGKIAVSSVSVQPSATIRASSVKK